jgi:hypothetical protein
VAELLEDVLRHPVGIGIVAHVGLREHGPAAHLADALHHVTRGAFAGDVVDGDVRAFLGERERDGAPDATGASGDERGTSLELHRATSCCN